MNTNELIVDALDKQVRVNTSLKKVEFYTEYGVKLVLKDLDEPTYEAFKSKYQNY